MYPDPVMQEVTHFCLPGFLPLLKNTVQFVHEVHCTCVWLSLYMYCYGNGTMLVEGDRRGDLHSLMMQSPSIYEGMRVNYIH